MAQRLVRKLCNTCKKEVEIPSEEKIMIDTIVDGIIDKEKYEISTSGKKYESVGCKDCSGIGYKGRIAVCEAILVDEEIEKLIRTAPGEREVREAARPQGIMNLKEDGIVKVLNGVTSLDELKRVIDLDE